MKLIKSADGIHGCLIYVHWLNKTVFRVYSATDAGKFTDYELMHSDLFVTIECPDAAFYETVDGRLVLDHAPDTLGLSSN